MSTHSGHHTKIQGNKNRKTEKEKKAVEREGYERRVIAAVNMRRADVRTGVPPTKFDGTSFAGSFPRLTRALHGVCLVRVGDRSRVELSPVPRDGPPCSVRAFIRHNGSRATTIVEIV